MMDKDPFRTQRDVGSAVVTELSAAGFSYAEEVGRGGFGIVYRCTQTALDRAVAVKVLTAELDENRERFMREQRAMGRLTGHPNIVGVLQVNFANSVRQSQGIPISLQLQKLLHSFAIHLSCRFCIFLIQAPKKE